MNDDPKTRRDFLKTGIAAGAAASTNPVKLAEGLMQPVLPLAAEAVQEAVPRLSMPLAHALNQAANAGEDLKNRLCQFPHISDSFFPRHPRRPLGIDESPDAAPLAEQFFEKALTPRVMRLYEDLAAYSKILSLLQSQRPMVESCIKALRKDMAKERSEDAKRWWLCLRDSFAGWLENPTIAREHKIELLRSLHDEQEQDISDAELLAEARKKAAFEPHTEEELGRVLDMGVDILTLMSRTEGAGADKNFGRCLHDLDAMRKTLRETLEGFGQKYGLIDIEDETCIPGTDGDPGDMISPAFTPGFYESPWEKDATTIRAEVEARIARFPEKIIEHIQAGLPYQAGNQWLDELARELPAVLEARWPALINEARRAAGLRPPKKEHESSKEAARDEKQPKLARKFQDLFATEIEPRGWAEPRSLSR